MHTLYFAYGSNLSSARLLARIASAHAAGVARLADHRLTTDKLGRDGSAKVNLRAESGAVTWGVLWRIDERDWDLLDRFEAGYARIGVAVERREPAGAREDAWTYRSELLTEDTSLAPRYKRFLLDGAREHRLPATWIAALEALPERSG